VQSSLSSDKTKPKIIATIPCYNNEPWIADIISVAKEYTDQVLVIDDGSRDRTPEVAKTAGALVISHKENMGYGEAIKTCFHAAKECCADILVTVDGDGQHNPEEIPLLLAPIIEGKADVVIGSRFLTDEITMPRYRKFGIDIITFLFNLGSKTKVSDTQSGFRAYSRRMIETLLLSESGMSISIESIEKARRNGAIITEVPISCFYEVSTMNPHAFRHGLGVALSVVKIRLEQSLFKRNSRNG